MIDLTDWIITIEKTCKRRRYHCYCDNCKQSTGYKVKSRHKTGLCKSCAAFTTHKDKIVSLETKQKMSKNHHLNNGGIHPLTGVKCSDITKAKLSSAAVKQLKSYDRSKFLYEGVNGKISMRSSWEVKYALYLDGNGISWEYEPDFKLEDGTIIEIKGYWHEDAKQKWECFCKDYPEINKSVLMKDNLLSLGINI